MLKSLFISRTAVFLAIFKSVAGLEMFLDLELKVLPGDQTTCGVLHCIEEGEEPRLSSITEMTVFKSSPDSGGRRRRTVASLSKRQSSVSTLWDGIKVDGAWSRQRAELTLYLVERDDCRLAEFSCEVHIVDGLQEERVGIARLGKNTVEQADLHGNTEDAFTAPTASLVQLSALLQQGFSSFHSTTTQLYGRVEDKIRDLENRLEDKISALDASLVRRGEGIVNKNARDRLDESLASLNALGDRLLGIAEKTEGAAVKDTPEFKVEARLVQRRSCERQDAYYQVVVPGRGEAPYLCDMHTEGGGWIVIQRRSTGNVDFYRNWSAYKEGFGSLADDFWLGNDRIHALTSKGSYELNVSLQYGNISDFAHYQTFSFGDEESNYTLSLGGYDGSAGDSLSGHKHMPFSTYDRDNDRHGSANCAAVYRGAWWYGKCHSSNLNGEWGALHNKGPRWFHVSGSDPVTFSEMKIRRLS